MNVLGLVLCAGRTQVMQGKLPRLLHRVGGQTLLRSTWTALEASGCAPLLTLTDENESLYRRELGEGPVFINTSQSRGDGGALFGAIHRIEAHAGLVLVAYGDYPFLSAEQLQPLITLCESPTTDCALLAWEGDSQADRGVLTLSTGLNVRHLFDATPSTQGRQGRFSGIACFKATSLVQALNALEGLHPQRPYSLNQVVQWLLGHGARVQAHFCPRPIEAYFVDTLEGLDFAKRAVHLEYAEAMYPLIDASVSMQGKFRTEPTSSEA